jgi:hypothetical protein
LTINNRTIVDKDGNINGNNGHLKGDLEIKGVIVSKSPANAKVLRVPSEYATLSDAITEAFNSSDGHHRFRIVLETQGPHVILPLRYASNDLEYLSIESASKTAHMGTYYGHLVGAYNRLGLQGLVDTSIAGCGPYNIVLSGGQTVITVTGTEVPYPYGFGLGVVQAPGWIFGLPPGVLLGITPQFSLPDNNILVGDVIRWFDATTNLVTEHTVTAVGLNQLTVSPAIANPVVKGSGFSIKPRATVTVTPYPLFPAFVFRGEMILTGLLFESTLAPPLQPGLSILQASVYLQQCLSHIEVLSSSGAKLFALAPNTFMDNTNGVTNAQLWNNSSGNVYSFCQNFIGPSAGFCGRGGGKNNCCFSVWVRNTVGILLTDSTTSKADGAEFYWCQTGVKLEGSSSIVQSLWFTKCGTAIMNRDGSTVTNGDITEYGPLPVVPLVIDGQGSGVGLDLDFDSQVSTTNLRVLSLTTHAVVDAVPVVVPTTYPAVLPTLLSGAGANLYGTRNSGFIYTNSDST